MADVKSKGSAKGGEPLELLGLPSGSYIAATTPPAFTTRTDTAVSLGSTDVATTPRPPKTRVGLAVLRGERLALPLMAAQVRVSPPHRAAHASHTRPCVLVTTPLLPARTPLLTSRPLLFP